MSCFQSMRGLAALAAILLFLPAPLVGLLRISSNERGATQEWPDPQPVSTIIRQVDSSRSMVGTPPPSWQPFRPRLSPENWREVPLDPSTATMTRLSQGQMRTPGLAHDPIYIYNNTDFINQALAEGWPGNGTAGNPYVIQSLNIDATSSSTTCIVISSTTVYFCIRDCFLLGPLWGWGGAIILNNVTHGCILNSTCTGAPIGMVIWSSTLITAANNNCSNNRFWGIQVSDSTSITVANNTCFGNSDFDIFFDYSRQNVVVNNTCTSLVGNIALVFSGDNTLVNNSLTGGGLWLEAATPVDSRQTLAMGNTLNAKPLLFWQDQVGGAVPVGFGQAVLVNCTQATIQDATISGAYAGIILCCCNEVTVIRIVCSYCQFGLVCYNCQNCVITSSAFSHNGCGVSLQNSSSPSTQNVVGNSTLLFNSYGIELAESGNTLWNNTCMYGWYGILVWGGSSNTIGSSWISNNSYGITFSPDAGGNLVEYNVFFSNLTETLDDSITGNIYDWNYWCSYTGSDWDGNGIGDSAYLIPGDAHSFDPRPLMLPPGSPVTWLMVPTNQYYPYGSYIWYDLDATATPPGITDWWLSDTTFFTIDQYGVVTNHVLVPVGSHWVLVWVGDWMGNVIYAGFNIVVYEWTTTTIDGIPIFALIVATVAAVSTAALVSIIGIVLLRDRRPTRPAPGEPFRDTRPPVDQWNARCPLCGSRLFGDEGFCPGCGNEVTKARGR